MSSLSLLKTLTLLVHAQWPGHFGVSIIHRTLIRTTGSSTCVCGFVLHVYTHGVPRFIVSSEGLLYSLHRNWLRRNLRAGAKPSVLILMWYVAGPNFRHRCDGRGVRTCKSDGALGDDPLLEVLKSGGLHLVVIEVVPVGGGADKERVFMLFSVGVGN